MGPNRGLNREIRTDRRDRGSARASDPKAGGPACLSGGSVRAEVCLAGRGDADSRAGPRPRAARRPRHLTGEVSASLGHHKRDLAMKPRGAGPSQRTQPWGWMLSRVPALPQLHSGRGRAGLQKGPWGAPLLGQSHYSQGVSGPCPRDTQASPREAFPGEAGLGGGTPAPCSSWGVSAGQALDGALGHAPFTPARLDSCPVHGCRRP